VELRFVRPLLRDLDSVGSELLACGVFEDERPARGTAGLIDWRMVSAISRHMAAGRITGRLGEVVMLPGKPRLPFDKVVLFGLGDSSNFDENVYLRVVEQMLRVLAGLKVRIAVVERPGRHLERMAADEAVDLLLDACESLGDQDTWTLVEKIADHKPLTDHLEERRRRLRMR
jgi:hypothetical protein